MSRVLRSTIEPWWSLPTILPARRRALLSTALAASSVLPAHIRSAAAGATGPSRRPLDLRLRQEELRPAPQPAAPAPLAPAALPVE
ncbi:MAG: hypothetical protein K6T74_09865, partial [Geminicoccaceae bacterium]|nr:hypothetical protein [Geminicoccaceae bacterium]